MFINVNLFYGKDFDFSFENQLDDLVVCTPVAGRVTRKSARGESVIWGRHCAIAVIELQPPYQFCHWFVLIICFLNNLGDYRYGYNRDGHSGRGL